VDHFVTQSITIAEARAGDIPTERRDVLFTPKSGHVR